MVRELSEIMMAGVPTHIDWAESLASVLVGMMCGMERYISNEYGKLYGNVFIIYIGASGLSFKTVPLKKVARELVKMITDRTNDLICQSYGISLLEFKNAWEQSSQAPSWEKKTSGWKNERARLESIKRRMVDYLAPQRFTSEFLVTWLNEHPQGAIMGDEYTKMVRGTKTKDYLSDTMEDLSRLYDCDVEKVGTQTRGVEYPENAYISFCSATTYYLLTLMTDDFFIQGTGNRIIWILDDIREKIDVEKEAITAGFFWGIEEDQEFKDRLGHLAGKLMNIRQLPEGVVQLSFNASVMLDRYRLVKYNDAVDLFSEDLLNRDANLIARLAQNAMKLALVHCVGRYAWEYDTDDPPLRMEITEQDAKWAIEKMERHYAHYAKIRSVAARVRKGPTKSYIDDQERVIYVIARLMGEGKKVTKTMIMQSTGWLAPDAQAILDAMLATRQIKMYTDMSGSRKVTYYTLPDTRR